MILEDILDMHWSPYGIACGDMNVTAKVRKFLREAVLDRHIYITKVVGYVLSSNNILRVSSGSYITRHEKLGESYSEIMVNLLDKVFLYSNDSEARIELECGMNTMHNNKFIDKSGKDIETLYVNDKVCRVLDGNIQLKLAMSYDCGYKSMPDNSKLLDSKYFPCYTDFSLQDYVRVPPRPRTGDLGVVELRYLNGMTEQIFKDILTKWLSYYKAGDIKEEERIWLQHSVL